MKINRSFLFKAGAVLLLTLIAAVMMIIGRSHVIFLDDKAIEVDGVSVPAKYSIYISVNGSKPQEIFARERAQEKIMGQKMKIDLTYINKKNSFDEIKFSYKAKVPYSMDTVIVNLPLLIEGYDQSKWMTEYVIEQKIEETSEPVITDEFSMDNNF